MNERIKELSGQAWLHARAIYGDYLTDSGKANHDFFDTFDKKFAELIVQRTLDIVEAHTEIFQSDEARAMVEHIKQSVRTDFGVEE